MPLYEYLCDACGHRFERIQKFSDPIADVCPKCRGAVHKLVSSPAIQFKGSGFYITDYAKKDHVAAAKADSAPASESKSETKSETKTESKSETKSETPTAAPPAASSPATTSKS